MGGRRLPVGVVVLATGLVLALVDVAVPVAAATAVTGLDPGWPEDVPPFAVALPGDEVAVGDAITVLAITASCQAVATMRVVHSPSAFPPGVPSGGTEIATIAAERSTTDVPFTVDRPGAYFFVLECGAGGDRTANILTVEPLEAAPDPTPEPDPDPSPDPDPEQNRPPVAVADAYAVGAGEPLTLARPGILGNDTDPDGDVLRAVHVGHVSGVEAQLRFRADGGLTLTPAEGASGVVCIEYLARDARGAYSLAPATVVVTVGDADGASVVTSDGLCDGAKRRDRNEYELTVEEVEIELPLEPGEEEAAASAMGMGMVVLASAPFNAAGGWGGFGEVGAGGPVGFGDVGLLAQNVRWPHGMYARRYFTCNQTIVRQGLSAFYGSMTATMWARHGAADYVSVRASYFQSGQRVHTTRWSKRPVAAGYGANAVSNARMHVRFGAPGETYTATYQVRWMRQRAFRPDVVLAQTSFKPIGYSCTSGGGM